MKKQKEDEMLDMQDNKFNDENKNENEMKKDNMLKSMKKSLKRNSDFRHLTCNVEKGNKNGLRRL